VYCGDKTLPWFFLVNALGHLESVRYRWGNWHRALQLQTLLSKLFMAKRFPDYGEISAIRPGSVIFNLSILQILSWAREKASKDPKDKIFALFGVSMNSGFRFRGLTTISRSRMYMPKQPFNVLRMMKACTSYIMHLWNIAAQSCPLGSLIGATSGGVILILEVPLRKIVFLQRVPQVPNRRFQEHALY